jgi:hypothetical protein
MIAQITYNRSERRYEFLDTDSGEMLTAPSGHKHELFKAAVGLLDPDLYDAAHRVIEKHPQLERITWKAVEIVTAGGVEILAEPKEGAEAMVASQSDQYGRYAVTNDNGYYMCQCEHFATNAPITQSGSRYCKHIVSMYLYRVTREERF